MGKTEKYIEITDMSIQDIKNILGFDGLTDVEKENAYYDKLTRESDERDSENHHTFGGGYEASKGDYEGACMARSEYYWGGEGGFI